MPVPDPIDLTHHLRAGVKHIYAGLDRKRGCRPYFAWDALGGSATHSFGDTPHVVGRFLDVLGLCAGIIDMPVDEQAVRGLTRLLHQSFARGRGFAWSDVPWKPQHRGPCALMHDQREALLALIALMTWKRSRRAAAMAVALLDRIDRTTRRTDCYPGAALARKGWIRSPEGDDYNAPATTGRLIGALVKYHRVSGSPMALTLARRFADDMLERCFDADGHVLEPAGTHMHSICGTCSGIIDLGRLEHDHSYVEAGRRIFDVGIAPYRTSYGWVKETRNGALGRGEPNNTADIVEAALYLGQAGYPAYFEDAETMVRNLLVRCQIFRSDWVGDGGGQEDTHDTMHRGVRSKIRGAFCFPTPNDFHSYNSDLTGAVMQGLCETWRAIYREIEGRVRVDLLLSRTDDRLRIESRLPRAGVVHIRPRRVVRGVAVRLAPWIRPSRLRATVDGRQVEGHLHGCYLSFGALRARSTLTLKFDVPTLATTERALGWPDTYHLRWRGNTVVGIRPQGTICPLFAD